jgi:hypothetical protein
LLILLVFSLTKLKLPETSIDGQQLELQPNFADLMESTGEETALPNFEVESQSWMLLATLCGIAVLVTAITFLALKSLSKRGPTDDGQYLELANKAQAALDDIEEAEIEFDDVIIRCYAEMSQALQSEKGIKREQAVTPHEFENELLAKGFPAHPVRQLTQLFVQVRYGHQHLGENAKERATESLHEIIAFCRGAA